MTDSERFQVSQGLHLDGEAWFLPRSPGRTPGGWDEKSISPLLPWRTLFTGQYRYL